VLDTLNVLSRIFGVHISHDPILLDFGLVSEQFTKVVISETHKRAFHNLALISLSFAALTLVSLLSFAESLSPC
jgi:hypothetical protein